MITLLIVSDIRLYSEGIREYLGKGDVVRVTSVATQADDAIQLVRAAPPMVVLVDQAMSQSLEVLRRIREERADIGIIALGLPEQDDRLLEWAEAGVTGFVPREAGGEELVATIKSAVQGDLVCSPHFAGTLLRQLARRAASGTPPPDDRPLTTREAEIVRLIDSGLSNKEIARELGIETATVKNHVHNVLEKLHVHRRGQAAARLRALSTTPSRARAQESSRDGTLVPKS